MSTPLPLRKPIAMSSVRDSYLRDLQENYNPQPNVSLASARYRDGCGKPQGNVSLLAYENRCFGSGRTTYESQQSGNPKIWCYHWDRRSDNELISSAIGNFKATTEAGGHVGREMGIIGQSVIQLGYYSCSYFYSRGEFGSRRWSFEYRVDSKNGEYYKTGMSARVYAYTLGYLGGDSVACSSWVGLEGNTGQTNTKDIDFDIPRDYPYVVLNLRLTTGSQAQFSSMLATTWNWRVTG